jgi:DNA-binding PadR family transcriptional regulator
MTDQILYRGLVRIHLLYHASREPIFGLGMIRELERHGYVIGPGTLYPILHGLEARGYLASAPRVVEGKVRRAYAITARGRQALDAVRSRVRELFREVVEAEETVQPLASGRGRRVRSALRPRRRSPKPGKQSVQRSKA